MVIASPSFHKSEGYRWGSLTLLAALAGIIAAWGFQLFAGFAPCPLCLQQRYAYYLGIPLLFAALVLLSTGRGKAAGLIFLLVGFGFLANAGLGVFHAGAEWKFWPGPDTCSAATTPLPKVGGILKSIGNAAVVRCDEAAGRFLGLSFAGWNVLLSVALCITAIKAAFGNPFAAGGR
jgi:disulfide bond formation protein DsbB